jgi:hypothetical protein
MNRTRLGALMIAVGVSSCMWACGDDDDDTGATGGTAGKAGSSTGGSGGKAGSSTGGSGGKAGSSTGGKGGNAPDAGAGGEPAGGGGVGGEPVGGGGAGGEPVGGGGAGGAAGGGGDGGSAGAGGSGELTLAEACAAQCNTFFTGHPAACDTADETICNSNCSNYTYGSDESIDALFLAYARCAASELTASSDFECGSDTETTLTATPMWPVASGACETELCAWACPDATVVDSAIYGRCGC